MHIKFLVELECSRCATKVQTTADVSLRTILEASSVRTVLDIEPDYPTGWRKSYWDKVECPKCSEE